MVSVKWDLCGFNAFPWLPVRLNTFSFIQYWSRIIFSEIFSHLFFLFPASYFVPCGYAVLYSFWVLWIFCPFMCHKNFLTGCSLLFELLYGDLLFIFMFDFCFKISDVCWFHILRSFFQFRIDSDGNMKSLRVIKSRHERLVKTQLQKCILWRLVNKKLK